MGLLGRNKATEEMKQNSNNNQQKAGRVNAVIEEEYNMSRTKIDLNITDETILQNKPLPKKVVKKTTTIVGAPKFNNRQLRSNIGSVPLPNTRLYKPPAQNSSRKS